MYSGSRSPSSANKQFHFQLIPNFLIVKNYKQINDENSTTITYHISMHKGFQNYDQIRAPVVVKSYEHQEIVPFGRIPHILNFYIPVYNSHRRIDFTLKLHSKRTQDQKLTQIGQMTINSNQVIEQFLNNGTKHFTQEQQVSETMSINYELFIEKTKLLLNDLVKQSMPSLHSPKKQTTLTPQIKSAILDEGPSTRRFSRRTEQKHQLRFGKQSKSNIQPEQQHTNLQAQQSQQAPNTIEKSGSQINYNFRPKTLQNELQQSLSVDNLVSTYKKNEMSQSTPTQFTISEETLKKNPQVSVQQTNQAQKTKEPEQKQSQPVQQVNQATQKIKELQQKQPVQQNKLEATEQIQNVLEKEPQKQIMNVKQEVIAENQQQKVQLQAKATQQNVHQAPIQFQINKNQVQVQNGEVEQFDFLMPQIVITACFDQVVEGNLYEKYENQSQIPKQNPVQHTQQLQPQKPVQNQQTQLKDELICKEQPKPQLQVQQNSQAVQCKQLIRNKQQSQAIQTDNKKQKNQIEAQGISPINKLTSQVIKDQINQIKERREQANKNWSRRSNPSQQDPTKLRQNEVVMEQKYHPSHHTRSENGQVNHPFGQNPKLSNQAPQHDQIVKNESLQKQKSREPTKKSQSLIDEAGDSQYIKQQIGQSDMKKSESVLARHGSTSQEQNYQHEEFNEFLRGPQTPVQTNISQNKQKNKIYQQSSAKTQSKTAIIKKTESKIIQIYSKETQKVPFEQKTWVKIIFLLFLLGSFYYFILDPIVKRNMYREPKTIIYGSDE